LAQETLCSLMLQRSGRLGHQSVPPPVAMTGSVCPHSPADLGSTGVEQQLQNSHPVHKSGQSGPISRRLFMKGPPLSPTATASVNGRPVRAGRASRLDAILNQLKRSGSDDDRPAKSAKTVRVTAGRRRSSVNSSSSAARIPASSKTPKVAPAELLQQNADNQLARQAALVEVQRPLLSPVKISAREIVEVDPVAGLVRSKATSTTRPQQSKAIDEETVSTTVLDVQMLAPPDAGPTSRPRWVHLEYGKKTVPSDANDDHNWAQLPPGAIDLYMQSLLKYKPRLCQNSLAVYAMPLRLAKQEVRMSAEAILHEAWSGDVMAKLSISNVLGLRFNSMSLRSGFRTPRCKLSDAKGKDDQWLIWEEIGSQSHQAGDARTAGALVLQRHRGGSDVKRGCLVMDYIAARRGLGGQGWPMVLAAEAMCRREGFDTLCSAADLSQDGSRAGPHGEGGAGISAVDAHKRWGFAPISLKCWRDLGLEPYNEERCCVVYMRKQLNPV